MLPQTERFTSRARDYAKYRPGYPLGVLRTLRNECGLAPSHIVADVGSGTGLLTELFLKNGKKVFGIEPNKAMREAGENYLRAYDNFTSVNATAEQTTLPSASVDLVVAGQAFHWFDAAAARGEFARILRPGGWAALIWNERRRTATPFLIALEKLLQTFTTDHRTLNHEADEPAIADFFAPNPYAVRSFDNNQILDYEGLRGRFLSASYVPEADHADRAPLLDELRAIFDRHAVSDRVTIEYDARLYFGRLTAAR
jgi:SAM-dependent methyltransferase